jgi:hypothetical protein
MRRRAAAAAPDAARPQGGGAAAQRAARERAVRRPWIGKWEAQPEHELVVELVVQNEPTTEVIAVYSWGVSAELGVNTPGWTRVRGCIENGALRLELTRVQATAVYTIQADSSLVEEYWRGDKMTSHARLSRVVREEPGL